MRKRGENTSVYGTIGRNKNIEIQCYFSKWTKLQAAFELFVQGLGSLELFSTFQVCPIGNYSVILWKLRQSAKAQLRRSFHFFMDLCGDSEAR